MDPYGSMDFFPSGIFWDPREPPPPEMHIHAYQPGGGYRARRSRAGQGGLYATPVNLNLARVPGPGDAVGTRSQFPIPPPSETGRGGTSLAPGIHQGIPHIAGVGGGSSPPASGEAAVMMAVTTTPDPPKRFPRSAVAIQGTTGSPFCVLVPVSMAIRARVVQDAARVTLTQTYMNDSDRAIEQGGYTFPLPSHCTVTSFSCRVGRDKVLRAHVKPKEEAKQAFQDAVVRDHVTAGLLEQATPEIFTTSLGNIPANTRVRVELSYVLLLKRRFGDGDRRITTTFTIPTRIAPRYGDAPESYSTAQASTDVARGLSLEVEIDGSEKVTRIASGTHKVTIERGSGGRSAQSWEELTAADADDDGQGQKHRQKQSALVKLEAGSMGLDGDFVLDIESELDGSEETPQALLEVHPTMQDQAALMVTIPPRLLLKGARDLASTSIVSAPGGGSPKKGEIVFLADRSGSMSDKIASLRSAMQFFLKGIPEGRKFNIWCFGSSFMNLWAKSVDYSEASLRDALDFVERHFRADMGGTSILPALEAVVAARDVSTTLDVVLLTDGEVWSLDETLQFIRQARTRSEGQVRFFALGVGDAVSHALVEGIANAGGGYSEVIPASVRDGWEDRVVAMVGAALSSRVELIQLEFQKEEWEKPGEAENAAATTTGTQLPPVLQSPANTFTLNPFQQSRVFVLFNSNAEFRKIRSVVLKTSTMPNGQEHTTSISIMQLNDKKGDLIHSLAARAALEELKSSPPRESPDYLCREPAGGAQATKPVEIGELIGCRFSIISKWTSFFLREEKAKTDEAAALVPRPKRVAVDEGDDDGLQILPRDTQHVHKATTTQDDDTTSAFIPISISSPNDVLNLLRPRGDPGPRRNVKALYLSPTPPGSSQATRADLVERNLSSLSSSSSSGSTELFCAGSRGLPMRPRPSDDVKVPPNPAPVGRPRVSFQAFKALDPGAPAAASLEFKDLFAGMSGYSAVESLTARARAPARSLTARSQAQAQAEAQPQSQAQARAPAAMVLEPRNDSVVDLDGLVIPKIDQDSIKILVRPLGGSRRREHEEHDSIPETELKLQKRLVRMLLGRQQFDGSFVFTSRSWDFFLEVVFGTRGEALRDAASKISGVIIGGYVYEGSNSNSYSSASRYRSSFRDRLRSRNAENEDKEKQEQQEQEEQKKKSDQAPPPSPPSPPEEGEQKPSLNAPPSLSPPPPPPPLKLPPKVAHTVMVLALLHLHLTDCADLWQLMADKAAAYIGKQIPVADDRYRAMAAFQDLLPRILVLSGTQLEAWTDAPRSASTGGVVAVGSYGHVRVAMETYNERKNERKKRVETSPAADTGSAATLAPASVETVPPAQPAAESKRVEVTTVMFEDE